MEKMVSKLNKSEFIKRLEQNTKIGDPKIKGTPFAVLTMFGMSRKKFYGEYTETDFQLTKNAVIFTIPYIFEGTLKTIDETSTEILFNIKPIWFGYLWIRVLPVLGLILINFLLITQGKKIETEIYVILNLFLVFMFTPILITVKQKNKLLKDFYKVIDKKQHATNS